MTQRRTFDSGATPKVGQARRKPATVADVDLAAIGAAMADTIEKAKADDPKELRRRVADRDRVIDELRDQLANQQPEVVVERVEIPVLDEDLVARLETALHEAARAGDLIIETRTQVLEALAAARSQPAPQIDRRPGGDPHARVPQQHRPPPVAAGPRTPTRASTAPPTGDLPAGEGRILAAIAQHRDGVTKEQLTVLTGYKRSSRDTYLQRLRQRGFVHTTGATIHATTDGLAALGDDFEPLPTGVALQEYWLATLPEGERRILSELLAAYPDGVPRDDLSESTGYKRSSRDTYLQRLRSRQLVTTDGDPRAADVLFDEGGR